MSGFKKAKGTENPNFRKKNRLNEKCAKKRETKAFFSYFGQTSERESESERRALFCNRQQTKVQRI